MNIDSLTFLKKIFFDEEHLKKYLLWGLSWVFIAARGLSLVAASRGYAIVVMHWLLIVMASLVAEHRL